eukprot:4621487-Pyramimonas_sp.AAC.1
MIFVDNSSRVMRSTDNTDTRTHEGKHNALMDTKEFKGEHISFWGSIPRTGSRHWQCASEAHGVA